ncbi:PilW family protein [Niallia nealsonii]|uniref:Prepilin-type N-terminal cleavage/methylation domain-containing protein n=1 Tax=Niallia nealsonii TaxID=115979 RepID=A0A2N0YWQ7_9BACI|nr:prepilin-type N-terminal cleavage/methylation domain-containing protein [Niallia nealsonii]PKG21680.1 hypothetical protein CWS01_21155 [Niallia nealsonii]
MIQNSKGLTLIELLAAVSLSAIILLLAYQFLFQGFQFSKTVTDKTLLQQEANYIMVNLTKIHQSSDSYTIAFDQNPNANYIKVEGKKTITFKNDHFFYELKTSTSNNSKIYTKNKETFYPKLTDVSIELTIYNKKNPKLSYSSKTILSRIK